MSQVSNDIVATLRRRSKDPEFNRDHTRVFERAADELDARRRHESEGELLVVQVVAENRVLRNALMAIYNQARAKQPAGWPDAIMAKAKQAIAQVPPFEKTPRNILAITIGTGATRGELLDKVYTALDKLFGVDAPGPVMMIGPGEVHEMQAGQLGPRLLKREL